MHIALFLPSLEGGGAERVTENLARGFASRGHQVDLVLASRTGPFLDAVPAEIRIVDLAARRVVRALGPLTRYLRESRPDALISSLDHANLIALWAVRRSRVATQTIVVVHTTMSRTIASPGAWTDRIILPPLIRHSYVRADAVVAVSAGAGADLRSFLDSRVRDVHVIANPVVFPDLASDAASGTPHPWFTDGGPPVLLGVGRLWHQKNFRMLLRAFARAGLQERARVVILGEGPLRRELELLRAELKLDATVALPGFTRSPYPSMLRAAALVLPSVFEALPTVLIEALALGTPVISTDCPTGPSEILEQGRWGTLVPMGDIDALARALCAAIDVAPARRDVPPEILSSYSVDTAIDRYLALLKSPARSRQ